MPILTLFTKEKFEQIRIFRSSSAGIQGAVLKAIRTVAENNKCHRKNKHINKKRTILLSIILLCVLHLSVVAAQAFERNWNANIGLNYQNISSDNSDLINGTSGYGLEIKVGYFIGDYFSIDRSYVGLLGFSPVGSNTQDGRGTDVNYFKSTLGVRTYLLSLDKRRWAPWIGIYQNDCYIKTDELDYDYSASGPSISVGLDVVIFRDWSDEFLIHSALTYSKVKGDQEFWNGSDINNIESEIIELNVSFGVFFDSFD